MKAFTIAMLFAMLVANVIAVTDRAQPRELSRILSRDEVSRYNLGYDLRKPKAHKNLRLLRDWLAVERSSLVRTALFKALEVHGNTNDLPYLMRFAKCMDPYGVTALRGVLRIDRNAAQECVTIALQDLEIARKRPFFVKEYLQVAREAKLRLDQGSINGIFWLAGNDPQMSRHPNAAALRDYLSNLKTN